MFWRNNKQKEMAAAIAALTARVTTLERCVLGLCDHVEALQRPRIVRVLDEIGSKTVSLRRGMSC
jgi:hypothetical protein